jgi:rod shape determining protein RodA
MVTRVFATSGGRGAAVVGPGLLGRGLRPGGRLRRARLDWLLLALTVLLCLAGALAVYAATSHGAAHPFRYLKREAINLAIGGGLCAAAVLVPYPLLRAIAPVAYGAVCVLLLAVLSPLGSRVNGARAWFSFGSVQLEPSEFAKLAVIGLLAAVLAEATHDLSRPDGRAIATCLGLTGMPLLLVLAEPALGVAIIIGVIAVTLIAIGGARARVVLGLVVGVAVAVTLVFSLHLLKSYQEQRFTALIHPGQDTSSSGYHTTQSLTAIGDGALTGQGFLNGDQTNGGFVPEQQTDFIFTVAAEEGGFLGAGALLATLTALYLRGLRIAARAPDTFGTLLAGGIVAWFAAQTFVNAGMTMGIMPVTGLPMPFISYGGTAAFADLTAVGLLLNIARNSSPVPTT